MINDIYFWNQLRAALSHAVTNRLPSNIFCYEKESKAFFLLQKWDKGSTGTEEQWSCVFPLIKLLHLDKFDIIKLLYQENTGFVPADEIWKIQLNQKILRSVMLKLHS